MIVPSVLADLAALRVNLSCRYYCNASGKPVGNVAASGADVHERALTHLGVFAAIIGH